MLSHFTLLHIPPLFVATMTTLGGLLPYIHGEYAIRQFGLPPQVAVSRSAQSIMITSAARMSSIGLVLLIFYYQGKLAEFDTVLSVLAYVGLADGYVCWREGVPGKGMFRATSGLAIAAWGWWGMTSATAAV